MTVRGLFITTALIVYGKEHMANEVHDQFTTKVTKIKRSDNYLK